MRTLVDIIRSLLKDELCKADEVLVPLLTLLGLTSLGGQAKGAALATLLNRSDFRSKAEFDEILELLHRARPGLEEGLVRNYNAIGRAITHMNGIGAQTTDQSGLGSEADHWFVGANSDTTG